MFVIFAYIYTDGASKSLQIRDGADQEVRGCEGHEEASHSGGGGMATSMSHDLFVL